MITNNQPRPEYPRPDLRREYFQDLNGEWAFAFDDADVDRKTIAVRTEFAGSGDKRVRVRLSLKGRELVDDTVRVHKNRADRAFRLDQSISLDWNHQETMVWMPEDPVLFDLDFEVCVQGRVTDHVTSYCALRKISVVNGKFMLNNTP